MATTVTASSSVPSMRAERIGDGIVAFLPAGMQRYPTSLALVKTPTQGGSIASSWSLRPRFGSDGTGTHVTLVVPENTDLYGTGEVTGPLRRNGSAITLWNTDNFEYQLDGGRQLYQSHPWVLGVRADGTAFGVLFDSTWRAALKTGNTIEFDSSGPPMPVIVIDRLSPQLVLQGLAELTGKMPLPPRWALGYQQSRWSYTPDKRVLEIADEFRKRRIPADVIWMDIDYMDGFRVFTFDPKGFPDPEKLNRDLHARGFHSVWMIDPGVKFDPGYAIYDSGTARDVWVKDAYGKDYHGEVWPGLVSYPDFTRPQTRQWWSALYANYMAEGIDGVWNDMNEPSVFKVPSMSMPDDNWHRGGGDLAPGPHLQYHNVYGMLMTRATRDGIQAANPDKRPFVLTRANFIGGQRYAATWTGDNTSTWTDLKTSIPMSINLGLSGQPFSGADIGGFSGETTPDLWANWIAIGAFYPFSRAHTTKASQQKEPWAFGPMVENTARIAIERRYRLLPYLYTLFHRASVDGTPVMQPVFFADPRDLRLRSEQEAFLLGGDLLVVPAWAKKPALPQGIWRTISLVDHDREDAHQATLKLRGGAIVPLGRVVQNSTEESLDPLTLLVSLDSKGQARGELYEDAGDGYGYRKGDYRLTTYVAERKKDQVVLRIAETRGNRTHHQRDIVVQVVTNDGVYIGKGDEKHVVVNLRSSH
ncbi:TIM-barrel domain-containing protein [Rhodanobacter sp. L36]|uniref:TIM-barrel domain-containing protein n=1 Tax=Rhodanobacter sp. L36 TaxID=1747221 RepID=UPI00131B4239|nr:TIM-barrel domain-containing protein [Rhodanobacter sp. L36]